VSAAPMVRRPPATPTARSPGTRLARLLRARARRRPAPSRHAPGPRRGARSPVAPGGGPAEPARDCATTSPDVLPDGAPG
jgi:hypothetical protein